MPKVTFTQAVRDAVNGVRQPPREYIEAYRKVFAQKEMLANFPAFVVTPPNPVYRPADHGVDFDRDTVTISRAEYEDIGGRQTLQTELLRMTAERDHLASRVAHLEAKLADMEDAAKMAQPMPATEYRHVEMVGAPGVGIVTRVQEPREAQPNPHPLLRAIAAKGDGVFRG